MDKKTLRDVIVLFAIIVIAAIGARVMAGGETLSDYADKNPEVALSESSVEKTDKEKLESNQQETVTSGRAVSSFEEFLSSSKESASAQTSASTKTSDSSKTTGSSQTSDSSQESGSSQTPDSSQEKSSDADTDASPERVTYMDGFYYEPISNEVFKRISGISYPVDCTVPLDELRYLRVKYVDFNGETQDGELICNKALAQDMIEIFQELYTSGYQIESIRLVDEFNGDDTASMLANNTSCFNYRVIPGTTRISNHATGRAVDINPFYNPYITYKKDGTQNISPEGSEAYADRSESFPYKIDENDLAYKLFKAHGFSWGGDWNSSKDYQHFEKK